MGKIIYKNIYQFLKFELEFVYVQFIIRFVLKIDFMIIFDFQWDEKLYGFVEFFWVFVEDNDGEDILYYEYFLFKMQYIEEDYYLSFIVLIYEFLFFQYFI